MELRWTSKAVADMTRLYDFLAPVNIPAAAKVVKALTAAPTRLLEHPRIGEVFRNSSLARSDASSSANTRCAMKSGMLSSTS